MTLCSVILAGTLAALAFRYCPVPWAAAFLLAAILLVIFARTAKNTRAAVQMVNIAAAVIALAIFESYIGIEQLRGDGTRMAGTITRGFTHVDDTLGYAPNRNTHVTAKKYYGHKVLYDVIYSIDEQGLRIAPPRGPNEYKRVYRIFWRLGHLRRGRQKRPELSLPCGRQDQWPLRDLQFRVQRVWPASNAGEFAIRL